MTDHYIEQFLRSADNLRLHVRRYDAPRAAMDLWPQWAAQKTYRRSRCVERIEAFLATLDISPAAAAPQASS